MPSCMAYRTRARRSSRPSAGCTRTGAAPRSTRMFQNTQRLELRFHTLQPDATFVLVSLTLSSWLYHFCQVGASVMVLVTSLVALGTGVLPRWLALAGFVVALLTLLHFLLPLLAALVGLLWIAAVSVLMLA